MPPERKRAPETAWRTKKCKFCRKEFRYKRVSAEYCDSNCRKRYSRLKDSINNHAWDAEISINKLVALGKERPEMRTSIIREMQILEALAHTLRDEWLT